MRSLEAQPALRSEVHLALHNDWGQVDIRARWVEGGLGATITVDRGELGSSLASQLPSLERSLQQHNLPVHALSLESGGPGAGSRDPGHAHQQHAPPGLARWFGVEESENRPAEIEVSRETGNGLSVHA